MSARRTKSPARRLLDYLDSLLRKLLELLSPAFAQGKGEAIHQARVATRRLSAALALFQPVLSEKRHEAMRRGLRRLRRRLGELRDLDVMVGHLEELGSVGRIDAAVRWVKSRLLERRERAASRAAEQFNLEAIRERLGEWWALREELVGRRTEEQCLLKASLSAQMGDFGGRADARAGDPHELRIAGKRLRYTFEMAKEAGLRVPGRVPAAFKVMQEALGLWHDHVVLAMRVMGCALEAELAVHDPALFHNALDLAREATRRAERQLDRFYRLWERNGGMVRQAVEQLTVQEQPQTAAQAPGADAETAHEPAA